MTEFIKNIFKSRSSSEESEDFIMSVGDFEKHLDGIAQFYSVREDIRKAIEQRTRTLKEITDKNFVIPFEDLTDEADDYDFALEDVSEETENLGEQNRSLNDVLSGLRDTITGIGPTAQNTFRLFGNSLVQSTQTGQQGLADLFGTSQRRFRTFLTDTQTTTRSATGAFERFASSARGAVTDSMFALLRGDMKRFGDIWKSFADSLLDTLVNTGLKLAQSSVFSFLNLDGGSGKSMALAA